MPIVRKATKYPGEWWHKRTPVVGERENSHEEMRRCQMSTTELEAIILPVTCVQNKNVTVDVTVSGSLRGNHRWKTT